MNSLMLGRIYAKYRSYHCKSSVRSYLVDNIALRCVGRYADKACLSRRYGESGRGKRTCAAAIGRRRCS